jgi:hypothetical protein
MLGLFLVFTIFPSFAEHPMIAQLIREKQQKMEKLESCKGTTKNLKIAGISTLGITAVGIGANIAEAVVLDKTKDKVEDAKKARDVQLQIKEERIKREEEERARQEQQMRLQMAMALSNQPGAAKAANVAGAQTNAQPSVQSGGNSITISMKKKVDNKTMALAEARKYEDAQNGIKDLALSEQLCDDSYPAMLTCKVNDKSYVFYFDLQELPEHEFRNPSINKDNIIGTIKANENFSDIDTSTCTIATSTVVCRKNNFAIQKFRFGYEKAAEAEAERISEFKDVRLDDIEQVKRLIYFKGLVSNSGNCKVESTSGAGQDFVKCEEDGDVKIFEFDNIVKSKNRSGQVEKSLQKYLCGTDNTNLIDANCAGDVNYIMYGTRTKPEVKEEKPAKAEGKTVSLYQKVQLNNLSQAKRFMAEVGVSDSASCVVSRTGVYAGVGRESQDFLKCGDTEYEFDDLSDSSNDQGGRVYTSLQKQFCGNTGKSVENEDCMKTVIKVWGGTIDKPEVKEEKKAEEAETEPSAKQVCKEAEPFAVWEGGECKYEGDECTTVLGSGIGVYEKTDDGLKCKIERCRLPGFDINVKNGGYSCTGLASEKAPKQVEEKPKQEEPKPVVLKNTAKQDCEQGGKGLWVNGECKHYGDRCEVFIGKGWGYYEETSSGLKCRLVSCEGDGYVVNEDDDSRTCKSASFNTAVTEPVAIQPKVEPESKVEPKKVKTEPESKKEEEHDWTVPANARYDSGYTNDRDAPIYWIGGQMVKIGKDNKPTVVDNYDDIKKREEEKKLKEEQEAREAKAQKQAEFEQRLKDSEQQRKKTQAWQKAACDKAGCGWDCRIDRVTKGVLKVYCKGIEKYYDDKLNDDLKDYWEDIWSDYR